jgi:hypothetical protein
MKTPLTLASLLESFFRRRLIEERNVSSLTVATYRDAMRLLVLYASRCTKRDPCRLEVGDLDREMVLGFLEHIERERGNGIRTRNARLTAIRCFFRHVAACDPGALAIAQRVLAIPNKRTVLQAPRHLCSARHRLWAATEGRILFEHRLDVGVEAVKTLPHVNGAQGHEDAGCRGYAQHVRPRRRRTRSAVDNLSRHRTVVPSGPTTSTAHPADSGSAGDGDRVNSWNRTSGIFLHGLRASASQRSKLETDV